ncbi:MAG TPA: YiiX/YebB-like N1pC/P60 family cysteine hydrolase [Vicinamibacteria bacterium]|nr:YiiX/YebB-like N1pC/P60 family cysteine hydrolase [Vicinamibacteria bacterium]
MRPDRALSDALVRFLTRELRHYQRRIPNNLENLKKHVRPGDVLLVEGKTRIAQIIKYITQSSWSHCGLYVGDRVVREDHSRRERYLGLYGDEARHLVLEADLASGVSVAPLAKYTEYNIRICRPYSLDEEDRGRILEEVLAHLGDRYDRRQLFDLGRYLTPFHLLPARWRRKAFFSGGSESRSVICSGLIAQAFLRVGYPILPLLPDSTSQEQAEGLFPWGRRMRSVHPRLVLPRDFDLSPYFKIVKFNSVEEGPIDYHAIEWVEPAAAPPRRASGTKTQ